MRMLIAALLLLAGASAAVAAELPSPPPEVAATTLRGDAYPAHRFSFPNGVRGIGEIAYGMPVGFRPLTLDLYLPPQSIRPPDEGFPLVVYIHGGGWLGGSSHFGGPFADFPSVLASLAARGYAVAAINYRLSGEARYPAQAQDVKAAIRFLRLYARKYEIDPTRAMTWGVSAGGHLSAIADVICNVPELEPRRAAAARNPDSRPGENDGVSDCIQGAVSWYGVFDMATIADQARRDGAMSRDTANAPEWVLLGCFKKRCSPEQIRLASPVSFVSRNTPPMLLITGDADTTVPYHQTLEMAAHMKAAGAKHEVIVMPGINHSLIGPTPEKTREANLKALAETFRFIDETIGRANHPGKISLE